MNRRSFIRNISLVLATSLTGAEEALSFVGERLQDFFPSLHLPGQKSFQRLKKTFNTLIVKKDPTAILQSSNSQEMSSLIKHESFASEPLYMRSGGHSYAAFSTGPGVILDSRKLNERKLVDDGRLVKLSSGVNLEQAFSFLDQHHYTFAGGAFPTVGVAGYLLGGGHSRRSRRLGIGADGVNSMDVMLASGDKLTQVSPHKNGDLFWAMLGGGGGNFAFVESFYLNPTPAFHDYFFRFTFRASQMHQIGDVFEMWEELSTSGPDHIAANLTIYIQNGYVYQLIVSGLVMDAQKSLKEMDEELFSGPWGQLSQFQYDKFESELESCNAIKPTTMSDMAFKGSSHYADQLIGKQGFSHILSSIEKRTKGMSMYMGFYAMGGAIKRPSVDVSYPHRSSKYMLDIFSNFRNDSSKYQRFGHNFNNLYHDLDTLFSGRAYVNYPNLDFVDWAERYYGDSLERLLAVKRKYDPHNRFDFGAQSLSALLR